MTPEVWGVLVYCAAVILLAALALMVLLEIIHRRALDVDPDWSELIRGERARERAQQRRG